MKKVLVLGLFAALVVCVASCGDDEEEAATATQSETAAIYCEKLEECDETTFQFLESSGGCAAYMKNEIFSEDNCPDYDAEAAAECIDTVEEYECPDFMLMVAGIQMGDTSAMPAECAAVCPE